jgi:3-phenylpropionate/trans-cinnamate dioxygenase ferredoxin subunit
MARVVLGALDDFADGRGTALAVAGHRLAVFRLGERAFAVEDRCAHRGFSLHDGTVEALSVRCRTHGACYDLASGAVLRGPARRAVRAYPTAVENGQVIIELIDR